jgi:hypothetical protein
METLSLPLDSKRFIVSNKGKIVIVTYNRRYAEHIASLVSRNNYPKSYELTIKKQ